MSNHGAGCGSRPCGESRRAPRIAAGFAVACVAIAAGCSDAAVEASPAQLAQGSELYGQHCASCHGAKLEGQANWRTRLPSGRLPAPPHDASGHTWHHGDAVLFGITKYGLLPGKYAPQGYQSDMPAFEGKLSDAEIRAVLEYIKSTWSPQVQARQREITQREEAAGVR